MKKILIMMATVILSLIITFFFAEVFSIYNFGSSPTLLTSLYLIALFSIFQYFLLSLIYAITKKIKKEKIGIKKLITLILMFIALIMILGYIIIIDVDYLHWYMYSSPFYINVIIRSLEFLLPAIILIIISLILLKRKDK